MQPSRPWPAFKTLARVFKEKKLTRKNLKNAEEPKGLTRFGYRHINELWMSA